MNNIAMNNNVIFTSYCILSCKAIQLKNCLENNEEFLELVAQHLFNSNPLKMHRI